MKASIVWLPAFSMVKLSHPCVTTGKTIALTIWIFVGKVMPLLFNTPSRFVIAFLLRSKPLLISWLQSPSSDFGARKIKSLTASLFPHLFCHEVMEPDAIAFGMLSFQQTFSLFDFYQEVL